MYQIRAISYKAEDIQTFINNLRECGVPVKSVQTFTKQNKHTILKSPHVNKKARDQIVIKHFNAFLTIPCSSLFTLLPQLKLLANNSVHIKVYFKYKQPTYFI